MNLKKFYEKNMHTALQKIRDELGEDAVIISSNQTTMGVEVLAATDYEAVANGDVAVNVDTYVKPTMTQEPINNEIHGSIKNNHIEPVVQKFDISPIQDEISQLREMIESQTELISWRKLIARNSLSRKSLQKLSISGFGFNLSKYLLDLTSDIKDFDQAWNLIESELKEKITITHESIINEGGMLALVGPTGVGKTTTIAKIAAQHAMKYGSNNIAIVSTDHFRIGAHDQISIYGSILNVPVLTANSELELKKALKAVGNKKLVLIDTAGLSQRDARVKEVMATLSQLSQELITYLVVSANSQLCVQKEVISNFMSDHLNGIVISKMDEASQIGGALTAVIESQLPIAYQTNGQRVPEDIARLNQNELLDKAFEYGKNYGSMEAIHSTELYSELVEHV